MRLVPNRSSVECQGHSVVQCPSKEAHTALRRSNGAGRSRRSAARFIMQRRSGVCCMYSVMANILHTRGARGDLSQGPARGARFF